MVDPLDSASLRAAFVALRTAIASRARGDIEKMRAPLRALDGLEQAAFNAPQNRGWLRKRQIELREALVECSPHTHTASGVDDLQLLYRDIAAILQMEAPRPLAISKPWLSTRRY